MDHTLTLLYCMLPIIFALMLLVAYLYGRVKGPRHPTVILGGRLHDRDFD